MKRCGRCLVTKELSEFNKDKYTKTEYRSQCKECMRIEREHRRDYSKQWRESPERKAWYAEYRKARYDSNRIKKSKVKS
jgi:hypothetical protein